MQFSGKSIQKFQDLHRNRFGEEISQAEAREQGKKLVRLFKIVYSPMSKEEFETLRKYKNYNYEKTSKIKRA